MKNSNQSRKRIILIAVAAVLAIALVVVLLFVFVFKRSNETELQNSLIKMGTEFYEDYYYVEVSKVSDERNNILAQYSDIGIKVDLNNLKIYNDGEFKEEIEKFVNSKTGETCNGTATRVVIYPKSPYGKTDYKIEAELDCGFETK